MSIVVVERSFETPAVFAEVQAAERRVAWCLAEHGVRFLRSYLSRDARSMVCVYEAPDVESVRVTQRKAGLPVTRAWTAIGLDGSESAGTPRPGEVTTSGPRPGHSIVVVARNFPEPFGPDTANELMRGASHCLDLHRVVRLASHLAMDGMRMVCAFDAPDAESVRIANRQVGMPVDEAWPATRHSPDP